MSPEELCISTVMADIRVVIPSWKFLLIYKCKSYRKTTATTLWELSQRTKIGEKSDTLITQYQPPPLRGAAGAEPGPAESPPPPLHSCFLREMASPLLKDRQIS